ncbi:hypothetical protein U1Q18_044717 [Sarracenia purpurea var. burkii]
MDNVVVVEALVPSPITDVGVFIHVFTMHTIAVAEATVPCLVYDVAVFILIFVVHNVTITDAPATMLSSVSDTINDGISTPNARMVMKEINVGLMVETRNRSMKGFVKSERL